MTARVLDFWVPGISQKIDLRQVEQGFSSFFDHEFNSWSLESIFFFRKSEYIRDTFFTIILNYLFPAPWIDYLEHLEHFYGIRSKSFIVKDLEISLQRFHITNITYKTRCEMLHNINSLDSSDGRVIGFHPQG